MNDQGGLVREIEGFEAIDGHTDAYRVTWRVGDVDGVGYIRAVDGQGGDLRVIGRGFQVGEQNCQRRDVIGNLNRAFARATSFGELMGSLVPTQ